LGEIWADLIRFQGNIKILHPPKKIRFPMAMPKCLLFPISTAGTTGMNLSI